LGSCASKSRPLAVAWTGIVMWGDVACKKGMLFFPKLTARRDSPHVILRMLERIMF